MSSELRVNKLTSRSGVGTVTFNDSGLIITGIATAATLDITGNATIAGVLSYDDVTNVDSVGLITARSGLRVVGTASSIGVGIANPAEKIDVAGSIQSDTGLKVAGHPVVGYANLGGGDYAARLGSTGSSTLNKTQIYARGAHVATFDGASGHVGINRTNPGGVLDILGSGDDLVRFQSADGDLTQRLVSADGNLVKLEFTDSSAYRGKIQAETDDSLTFYTGGVSSERVRITSAGNIGIGINNPSQALDVQSSSNQSARIQAHGFIARENWGVHTNIGNGMYSPATQTLAFATNSVERVRITSAGNFGIGVTPNVKLQVKLDTDKHLYFQGNIGEIGNVPGIQGVTDAGALASLGLRGNDLRFATGNAERMRIDSAGKLGLGTNSPKRQLHIHGGNETVKIQITNTTTGSSTDGDGFQIAIAANGDAYLEQRENSPLIFSTNNTERMRIDSSGKVIIGTNTAATNQKLTIRATEPEMALYATPGSSSILNMGDTDNYQIGRILYQNGDNSMRFYTNVSERMRIDSSGNICVGRTSASSRLDLQAASGRTQITLRNVGNTTDASTFVAAEEMTATNADLILAGRHAVRFFSNLNEKARIDRTGYFGIGTVNPARAFHNAGTGSVTLTSGTAPQYRLVAAADDADTDDTKRAMLGLCTANGHFFNTSAAGDTILRSTDNSALLFGEGQSERFRMDSSGRLLVGTSTSRDSYSHFQSYRSSGPAHNWLESANLANGNTCIYRAKAAGANGNTREAWIGVYKHSAITSAAGFIFLDQENSNNSYFWADNSGNFRRTGSSSNIGTTNGTVVGTQTSDERLKNVGENVSYGLAEVLQLQPKQYALKSEPNVNKIGFIAQEVESIIPEAVFDTKEELEGHEEGDRTQLGMEYVQLIPVLVNAIKEQQTTIADLQSRLSALEG